MATKKKLPTQIVASLSSSGGDSGTTYFAGYVLDVSDKLREKIDQYYEVVAGDDGLHSISLDISGFALPGGDNDGPDGVRERDKEKLEELLDKLQEDEPRAPTSREFNFLKKMEAYGCRGERLVITKYSAHSSSATRSMATRNSPRSASACSLLPAWCATAKGWRPSTRKG